MGLIQIAPCFIIGILSCAQFVSENNIKQPIIICLGHIGRKVRAEQEKSEAGDGGGGHAGTDGAEAARLGVGRLNHQLHRRRRA